MLSSPEGQGKCPSGWNQAGVRIQRNEALDGRQLGWLLSVLEVGRSILWLGTFHKVWLVESFEFDVEMSYAVTCFEDHGVTSAFRPQPAYAGSFWVAWFAGHPRWDFTELHALIDNFWQGFRLKTNIALGAFYLMVFIDHNIGGHSIP